MYVRDPVRLWLRHLYQVEFCSFLVRYPTAGASVHCGHISSFFGSFSENSWLLHYFFVYFFFFQDCIPQYLVGHNKKLDNIFSYIRDNKLPLSLIGSSYEGVSVNDCIYNARLAVEAVTGTELL